MDEQYGTTTVRGDVSSQFLSGLLLAAPYAQEPITLTVEGALVSAPYVTMTLDVMRAFGVESRPTVDLLRIVIPTGRYVGQDYEIEPDASAASYFFAAAAITGGGVTVEGLTRRALQGDDSTVGYGDLVGVKLGQRQLDQLGRPVFRTNPAEFAQVGTVARVCRGPPGFGIGQALPPRRE